MRETTRLGPQRTAAYSAPVTHTIPTDDATLERGTVRVNVLPGDGQTERVQVAERSEIGRGKGSVEHVEVFQLGGVGTPILEDLDPYPGPPTRTTDLQPQL